MISARLHPRYSCARLADILPLVCLKPGGKRLTVSVKPKWRINVMRFVVPAVLCATLITDFALAGGKDADPSAIEFFETQVRPVLAKNCISCHGPAQQFSGLRLDSREQMLKGGTRGPSVLPGNSANSLLTKAIRQLDLKMPVGGKLTDGEIAAIEKWIDLGAPWPAGSGKSSATAGEPAFYERIKKEHWAYQPIANPNPPVTRNQSWSGHPVDRFVLAGLEKAGLQPAADADRRTLIRRLSLVLTGLPPSPLEVDLFERDPSLAAYEKLIDRLLASPHFGEQWARHWMDVMRFAETFGNDWNYEVGGAWRYRDYLIRAFNQDVPYDQLIREHLAGDLIEKPRLNPEQGLNESIIGTAFLRLGELGHDDCVRFRQIRTDVVDNQIDTLGKAFLGLTIACARCHDHKLDPIPTADYYALYGVLTSTRIVTRTADTPGVATEVKNKLLELKPRIQAELARQWIQETSVMPQYLQAAERARRHVAPEPDDLQLSIDRLQAWLNALNRAKAGVENPLHAWVRLAAYSGQSEFAIEWGKIAAEYKAEAQSRAAYNQENFRPFGDFGTGDFAGWHAEGAPFTGGASPSGEFALAPSGPEVITGVFPAGLYTHGLSQRLNGALRSPYLPKDKKFVSLQIVGGNLGSRRGIIDNCVLGEGYELINQSNLAWIKVPNRDDQPQLPFYVELVTKAYNPRIPDRPGRLKATPEQVVSPNSYFGIARAVLHDVDATPKDDLSQLARLFGADDITSVDALANRYAAITRESLLAWAAGKASDDDARWIGWMIENKLLANRTDLSPALRALMQEYRAAESLIAPPNVFPGVADLDPGYDFPVLAGGEASRAGNPAPRGFLRLITKSDSGIRAFGSGRREVSDLIASSDNPLTARVMVNRVWQHLFGRGIVPTADNFGVYGERPSHPELLDYLATRFMKDGWSVKKLIRFIALSKTFQQSSLPAKNSDSTDPQNRLLSHYAVHRMEAETVRDEILSVSGRLDPTLYGPSIQPHREEPKDYRNLHQGPLDGDGRRSIYLKVTRHEGSRLLETFDFPNPNVARGNRDTTNVPPQALTLMNDSFVIDQASVWADRLIAGSASTVEDRIEEMFRAALGRPPRAAERDRFAGLARELAALQKSSADRILMSHDVWKGIAHTVFNLKEFIYIR